MFRESATGQLTTKGGVKIFNGGSGERSPPENYQKKTVSGGVAPGKIFDIYKLSKGNLWANLIVKKLTTKGGSN